MENECYCYQDFYLFIKWLRSHMKVPPPSSVQFQEQCGLELREQL